MSEKWIALAQAPDPVNAGYGRAMKEMDRIASFCAGTVESHRQQGERCGPGSKPHESD